MNTSRQTTNIYFEKSFVDDEINQISLFMLRLSRKSTFIPLKILRERKLTKLKFAKSVWRE